MLKNRLLAIGVTLFLLGISISAYSGGTAVSLSLLAVTVLCVLLCTVRFFKRSIKTAAILAVLPLLGAIFLLFYRNIFVLPYTVYDGKNDKQTGTVTSVSSGSFDVSLSSSTAGVPLNTSVRVYSDTAVTIGDTVTYSGRLRYAGGKTRLLAAGVKLYITSYDCTVAEIGSDMLYELRTKANTVFDALEDNYAVFLKAIVLNDKTAIGDERYDMYRIAGAAAYFSVSGLHISYLTTLLTLALKYLRVNRFIRNISSAVFILVYASLIGFSPSVSRAVIMFLVMLGVQLMLSEADTTTSLFFALGILLAFNPYCIFSLSLQLSFSATLGVIYSSDIFAYYDKKKKLKSLFIFVFVIPIVTSLGCFAFTLPFMAFSFDVVSLTSILSNIFLSMIFSPLLIIAFASAILGIIGIPIMEIVKYPLMLLIDAFDDICGIMSSNLKLIIPNGNIFTTAAAVVSAITILTVLLTGKRIRRIVSGISTAAIFAILMTGVFVMRQNEFNSLSIAYKNSYNGSYVVSVFNGEKIYIDCGGGIDASFIYSQQITSIDTYIIAEYNSKFSHELSYAVNLLGVKKIILLGRADSNGYSVITPADSDCIIIDDKYYSLHSKDSSLYIDGDITYLHSIDGNFAVLLNGSLNVTDYNIDKIVINNLPEESDTILDTIEYIPTVYIRSGIDVPEALQPYITTVDYGSSVKAYVVSDGNIEVQTNES